MRNVSQGKDENQDRHAEVKDKKVLKCYKRVISDVEMKTK